MTDDRALRRLLHDEGDRFTPSADPDSVAAAAVSVRPDTGGGRRRPATRPRRLSIALLAVVLLAAAGGIVLAARHGAPAARRNHATSTTVPSHRVHLPLTLSDNPATAPRPLPLATAGSRSSVPWQEVGPGWLLVLDDDASCRAGGDLGLCVKDVKAGDEGLFLVSPVGSRYLLAHFAVDPGVTWTLLAWSPRREEALLQEDLPAAPEPPALSTVELDLRTGALSPVAGRDVAGFGPSAGEFVAIVAVGSSGTDRVEYVSSTGRRIATLLQASGAGVAVAPNGGLILEDLTGSYYLAGPHHLVPLQPAGMSCATVRPWSTLADLELMNCETLGTDRSTGFYVASLDGSSITPLDLPAARVTGPADSPWKGDASMPGDVFAEPAGEFVTDAGACATTFLGRQRGASVRQLIPPGVSPDASMQFIGEDGTTLLVAVAGNCSSPARLFAYDTATATWKTLLESVPDTIGFDGNIIVDGDSAN